MRLLQVLLTAISLAISNRQVVAIVLDVNDPSKQPVAAMITPRLHLLMSDLLQIRSVMLLPLPLTACKPSTAATRLVAS